MRGAQIGEGDVLAVRQAQRVACLSPPSLADLIRLTGAICRITLKLVGRTVTM